MQVKGEYRDILLTGNECIIDRGWRSNNIASDFGRFLAALMKKDFNNSITERAGIDYIALGGWSGNGEPNENRFKTRIKDFFISGVIASPNDWAWVKPIDRSMIKYIPVGSETEPTEEPIEPTNRIRIDITIDKNEPSQDVLELKEFGLIGIDRFTDGAPNPDKIFLINYVNHDVITKTPSIELSRSIVLTFL